MATFYVRYRKNGPVGAFSVIAPDRETAINLCQASGLLLVRSSVSWTSTRPGLMKLL
jgi:hypothetical protein